MLLEGNPSTDERNKDGQADVEPAIAGGDVVAKPNIKALEGTRVRFSDDTVEDVDVIIYATGYNVTFPFFDRDFICAPNNELPLFKRVFQPGRPGLFFAALCQPLGAIMPIAEAQGQWLAAYVCGQYALPSVAAMQADMERERAAHDARYVKSARHTMQVDFDAYLDSVRLEMAQGRARVRGQAPPGFSITPRARHG